MQEDFHYYATYCAAYFAGYSHDECLDVCYSANFVDLCSETLIRSIKAPLLAVTTQSAFELAESGGNTVNLQDITRVWSSFHFLPYDLYAEKKAGKRYLDRFRLICNSNGTLVFDTVELAKDSTLQAAGIAMHVLADTWAHKYFAGTPSQVINSTNYYFYEITDVENGPEKREVHFINSLSSQDDIENGTYTHSLASGDETSVMNLGHGRAGHFPDYSFARYEYMPAWGHFSTVVKDNPSDYLKAFTQMIYALKYLHGDNDLFELDKYDNDAVSEYLDEIMLIIQKRQLIACDDWKAFGEKISGRTIPGFDKERYLDEYRNAGKDKSGTFIGKFCDAAIAQKSMVTNRIYESGNKLAGYSKKAGRKK